MLVMIIRRFFDVFYLFKKNIFWQKGGNCYIRKINGIADFQIHRYTADGICLVAIETPLLEQVDHIYQSIAGGQCQILALLSAVLTYGYPYGCDKVSRYSPLRCDEIAGM